MSALVFGNKSFGQNDIRLNLQIYKAQSIIIGEAKGEAGGGVESYIWVIKMVSSSETYIERLISILAHQLVQLLSNVVHLYFFRSLLKLIIKLIIISSKHRHSVGFSSHRPLFLLLRPAVCEWTDPV